MFADLPDPPYYAVIFSSTKAEGDTGYGDMSARMMELAAQQEGYLGIEFARSPDGFGITVSYWRSQEDIAAWRRDVEHTAARDQGRAQWYSAYELRIARVERAYSWQHG